MSLNYKSPRKTEEKKNSEGSQPLQELLLASQKKVKNRSLQESSINHGIEGASEVEEAKMFWNSLKSHMDVDCAFNLLYVFLNTLKENIKDRSATDQEYVKATNIMLEADVTVSIVKESNTIEHIAIDGEPPVTGEECDIPSCEEDPVCDKEMEDAILDDEQRNKENQPATPPLMDDLPTSKFTYVSSFQSHDCSRACLHFRPLTAEQFRGRNPLIIPSLCHFQRQHAKPEWRAGKLKLSIDVFYKTPCGRSLRNFRDVNRYLQETECDFLHLDYFSFNTYVMIQRNLLLKEPIVFEKDISKGTELVAVQLHNDSDEMKPELFRYRKDRWPHGCFISDSESLFKDCCDCTDGCTDKTKCACLKLTLKAKSRTNASKASALELYMYKRLFRPVPSGIYECSPWCSCDQRRCQNRVVQHGLRVRLQVFKTKQRGWGVRCLDDIDEGTFVCTYAGKILREAPTPPSECEPVSEESNDLTDGAGDLLPSSNKRRRDEQPSDDDVEVVEEKKNPQEKRKGPEGLTASYSLDEDSSASGVISPHAIRKPFSRTALVHVQLEKMEEENYVAYPQSSSDEEDLPDVSKSRAVKSTSSKTARSQQTKDSPGQPIKDLALKSTEMDASGRNGRKVLRQVQCEDVKKLHCWSLGEDSHDEVTGKKAQCNHETEKEQPVEDNFYYLDATEEGNVGRFLNHSCSPNLFVQNVFVDSHDKNYPIIAFFTNRHVKAGTELTWNYMYKPGSCLKEEVPCHCGSDKCQKTLI